MPKTVLATSAIHWWLKHLKMRLLLLTTVAVFAVASPIPAADTPPPVHAASREVRACVACHPAQAKPHPSTSMAHAMETVEECVILREHAVLAFQDGGYKYTIKRDGNSSIYSVTDGVETLEAPIGWAFGLGLAGQTYVYQYKGEYYESRVSFYKEIGGLDLTMGAIRSKPHSIVEALGRHMASRESMECFACHTTNTVLNDKLDVSQLVAGVACERCHGSSDQHLEAFKSGKMEHAAMKKLGSLNSEETNDFCGGCHRTWAQIASGGPAGIANIRFQPYRITNSKCYDAEDTRIRCIACHNPHENLVRGNTMAYDAKCTACHSSATNAKAKVCPKANQDCASCHMPRLSMPGSHHLFTDHQIRIVRANEAYPN